MKQKKELSLDEEVNLQINRIFKQARINSLKKYLPNNIDIDPFPNEKKNKNEEDDELSMETQFTYKDTCDLLKELDEKIHKLRIDNKETLEK